MKRLNILLLCLFICLFADRQLHAQTPVLIHDDAFQEDAVAAIDSLYNRNEEAAREIMQSWKQKSPDHPLWTMWEAMEIWWEVLEDIYDHSMDEKLMEAMQKSDYQAGKLLNRENNHPDALIIRALANGYIARHYANREEWITSVRTARKAYVSYQQLMEIEPEFVDNEFVRGMVAYYSAYIPDEYPVVKAVSWFLPEGNREEGLRKIDFAAREGVFSRPEATYFMGNILLNYEENYNSAIDYFQKLIEDYPDNGYYRRLYVRTIASQNRNEEVLQEVKRTVEYWEMKGRSGDKVLLEELRFWEGRALYRLHKFNDALIAFQEAIEYGHSLPNRAERLYYCAANYYAGLTSEALQDKNMAKKYYSVSVNQKVDADFKSRARERLKEL